MQFGVMNLFPYTKGKSEKQVFDEALEELVYAEELGFDSVWIAEHHFTEYGILGNPLVFAAALAAKTKKIKIGTAVMVLPFYNPIRLAEDAALVDVISQGRFEMGIGRGYQPGEFKGFGIDQSEARGRFNETVEIITQAWTQEEVNFKGKYFNIEGLKIYPKPVQKPIPLHFASVSNDTFKLMGKLGRPIITSPNFTPVDIITKNFNIYRESLSSNGFDPSKYNFPLMQQVHVAKASDIAKKDAVNNTKWYNDLLATLLPGDNGDVKDYEFYSKVRRNQKDLSMEFLEKNGGNFGDPEEVAQRIKFMEEDAGINQYICWFNFGQMGHKKAMEAMELFAKEVMPMFRETRKEAVVN